MRRYAPLKAILTVFAAIVLLAPVAASANGATDGELSVGPDVTIISLQGISNYGDNGAASACPPGYTGTCRGYSVGTDSCNIGSVPVDWCDQLNGCRTTTDQYHPIVATTSDHSVIAQNLYRLKDGSFRQIGMSFLKHGFVSTNSDDNNCVWNDDGSPNTSCVNPPAGGDQLGVGCTDFYGSTLNGGRPLGRRSDVQVAGAAHPPEGAGGQTNDSYDQRIVVTEDDLDPANNGGALYWVEGQYVVRDDARAGNGLNNASYRAATIGSMPDLDISLIGDTVREVPAIFAWQVADPEVEIVNVDRVTAFIGEDADPPATGQTYPNYTIRERFHVGRRVSRPGGTGFAYHYEYTVHNLNSDTSADGFSVEFPTAASFGNVGFHDIDHHSGEPYDTTDWTINVDGPNGQITWAAVDAGDNTNALRWGTSFTFWFDSNSPPVELIQTLDLFKIDETRPVPFPFISSLVFEDGFETNDLSGWAQVGRVAPED
ncbi:MAG: hypothetical protein AAF657_36565 [Acidobacteriota bacterium]